MPADLVGGKYPQHNAIWSILGRPANAIQSNVPVRTNLEYTGIGGLLDTAASLVSGVMTAVMVPVDPGVEFSTISVLTGATAASTPTHSFAALYSGTTVAAPPLIGQSTDGTTTAIGASARFDFTLTNPATITPAQAPYGYVWAAISVTGTAVPSLITGPSNAAAAQYAWFTNFAGGQTTAAFAITSGSAVGGTATPTLVYASQKLIAPIVFLS